VKKAQKVLQSGTKTCIEQADPKGSRNEMKVSFYRNKEWRSHQKKPKRKSPKKARYVPKVEWLDTRLKEEKSSKKTVSTSLNSLKKITK
jgi:hypothetical protein